MQTQYFEMLTSTIWATKWGAAVIAPLGAFRYDGSRIRGLSRPSLGKSNLIASADTVEGLRTRGPPAEQFEEMQVAPSKRAWSSFVYNLLSINFANKRLRQYRDEPHIWLLVIKYLFLIILQTSIWKNASGHPLFVCHCSFPLSYLFSLGY